MTSTTRGQSAAGLTVALVALAVSLTGASTTSRGFDKAFYGFLYEHDFMGGAAAAMKDGRLLFARGFGEDRAGKQVTAHSQFHVSSLAKSFTGIAVMRLVQEGRVELEDKVFGQAGLLKHIEPWREETVDDRLRLVTVDHLLRHSCGWDADQGPLFDPLLNKLYLSRGHDVPDIARHMGESHPIMPESLISYVMSQPLSFTPGTETAYSNMAYLVLGRVVEVAAKMAYRDFVTKYILEPCGMWNTRLERKPSLEGDQSLLKDIDILSVDSALGWFSTVFDLMRFARCTFETGQVLNDSHLQSLLARGGVHSGTSRSGLETRSETWFAAGFLANSHDIVWQESDAHADGFILYHDLRPRATARGRDAFRRGQRPRRTDLQQEVEAAQRDRLPESWVVLLHGKSIDSIRQRSRELMSHVDTTERGAPRENLFLYDLSELHRHPAWDPDTAWSWRHAAGTAHGDAQPARRAAPQITMCYYVDEIHLSAYISALQDEGYDIHWFASNPQTQKTSFMVMGKPAEQKKRSSYDFVFKHGLDHRRLLKEKLWLEQGGYNLTQLHSYVRRSSDAQEGKRSKWSKESPSFAAVFRFEAFPQATLMKYGTGHLPEPYHKLVQMYHENDFYPLSQTVTWAKSQKSEEFAFVFIKSLEEGKHRTEFRQQYDLTAKELSQATAESAKTHLRLAYLNSYNAAGGRSRFSAVYTNSTRAKGLLQMGQPKAKASEITISNMRMGLAPKFMVPYKESGRLRYAIYYEEF